MKLKIFTYSLRLATISFLGILTLSSEAKAASIKFGQWTLDPVIVTSSLPYGNGRGSAAPNTLKALASATTTPNPASRGSANATTRVSLSNFFTVEADQGENVGDTIEGFLVGNIRVFLIVTGLNIAPLLTGSFNTTVTANVDAGFQTFSYSDSISASVLILGNSIKEVNVPFRKAGILTIGQQYPFNMDLTVSASKSGVYHAYSRFDNTFIEDDNVFTADVQAVPEPLTIVGSGLALGFGTLFKKEHFRKQKKAKSLEK
jgi:hypothetical protein